ncbi:iron-sulfur cluster assembly scaffold protein [Candidatus Dependentiae bacterium]|nr:iron-sulfur cluster assembly scaffold protein [Candidatus Dependentiae bacterium]
MENKNYLYQQELLDYYRHPRNKGKIDSANFSSGVFNPSCGDNVILHGIIQNNKVIDIKFDGSGCVISQASSSMFTEKIKNKTIDELEKISVDDILSMVKIPLGPTRLRCALLVYEALKSGIESYKKNAQAR